MSSILIQNPIDNEIKKSKKHSKKSKSKTQNIENKENIQNNIQPQRLIEEEKESSKQLNPIMDNKQKNVKEKKPKNLSKKEIEIMNQKIKEDTMRNEVDKIYHETERLKQEYEEKNSKYFLFNNPQFIKYIKKVEKQLYFLMSLVVLLSIFSILMVNNTDKIYEGIVISSLVITILSFSDNILLIACVKIGLLNDSELSKSFRFFAFLESILLLTSLCFNFSSLFMIKKKCSLKYFIVIFFILIIIDLIFVLKKSLDLFIETFLILTGKKTEYSILISKDNDLLSRESTLFNLNTSSNKEDLNKTNSNLISDNNFLSKFNDKKENIFKNYFPFNKFHYSVTSERKNDYNYFDKK